MSNDKPTAIAIIKFYANKHVEVELDTLKGITPRTLSIAGHILQKTYAGMRGKFIADEHRKVREAKAALEVEKAKDVADFHADVDERNQALAEEALKSLPQGAVATVESEVAEEEVEEVSDEDDANDSDDKTV